MRAGGLVPRRHRPRYGAGGAVDPTGDDAGLGAFVGDDWPSPASIAPDGIGDAYHALFGPDDIGSTQFGTPVAPGGIGDAYRALHGNFAPAPSADDIAPGGIGDAYKALMVSGTAESSGLGPGEPIDDDMGAEQLGQLDHPGRFDACDEAADDCKGRTISPHVVQLCQDSLNSCYVMAFRQMQNPNDEIMHVVFPGGIIVELPGRGRVPYVLRR